MCAQLLIPSLQKDTVEEVVGQLLAMQGQQVYSFPHAALIRTKQADFNQVKTAFETNRLVRHRPMRGTVHITHARDYHWLRLALNQRPLNHHEEQLGLSTAIFLDAAQVAYELIKTNPDGIRRKTLFQAWQQIFSPNIPADFPPQRYCNFLMWGLDRYGLLIEGPIRKNEHLFIDARTLPAADSPESGFLFHPDSSPEKGWAEIAYRYAKGHGPISIADFARWTNLNKTKARQALENNAKTGRLARYQVTDTGLKPSTHSTSLNDTYYLDPQLFTTLEQHQSELHQTLFLPAFDELHLGYQNRTCLTDETGENLICPAKNGMFKPIIIQDGQLIAVKQKDQLLWIKPPSAQQKQAATQAIAAIQKRMNLR